MTSQIHFKRFKWSGDSKPTELPFRTKMACDSNDTPNEFEQFGETHNQFTFMKIYVEELIKPTCRRSAMKKRRWRKDKTKFIARYDMLSGSTATNSENRLPRQIPAEPRAQKSGFSRDMRRLSSSIQQ